jgi:hypothetical protein
MSYNNKPGFSERLRRFFEGRNGNDELSRLLIWGALGVLVVSMATGSLWNGVLSNILWAVSIVLLGYGYFRMFSKNIYARQAENAKYVALKRRLFGDRASRARRKAENIQYKHFTCPACKTKMRVPRGKGRVKITCKQCGSVFYGKT